LPSVLWLTSTPDIASAANGRPDEAAESAGLRYSTPERDPRSHAINVESDQTKAPDRVLAVVPDQRASGRALSAMLRFGARAPPELEAGR
jgi:hypothetical protein